MTLADRIKRLERDEAALQAELAGAAQGSLTALTHTRTYLKHVTATLAAVRQRHAARLRAAAAVSKQAPTRQWLRPSPPPPTPAPLHGRAVQIDGVEYLAIWPLLDDPKAPPTALNQGAAR